MARIRKTSALLRIQHSKNLRMPIRLFQAAFGFVFEKFIERSENEAGSTGINADVEIDLVIEKMCVALPHHAKGSAIDVKIRGTDNAIFDCERHIRLRATR